VIRVSVRIRICNRPYESVPSTLTHNECYVPDSVLVSHHFWNVDTRHDIDYHCIVHETGKGLFAHAKGRPVGGSRTPIPFEDKLLAKVNDLRTDFGLHNDTKMMVMLSLATKDMNRYVAMYPEVWFIDCTAGMSISFPHITLYNFIEKFY